ncbi:type I-B CRISPR-associated protein Cas5b [Clostridium perfringens]
MEILKFNLSGKTAFFKKPDVNTYRTLSYGQIHKIAILGMFGAIIGLNSYAQQGDDDYPEFYEKLKDIKVGIVPLDKNTQLNKDVVNTGCFKRSIQKFNNSVGYASQEEGGNLIVTEQWIEDVSWDIYLMCDSDISKKIKDYIINKSSVYIPFLGKNDHVANISRVELFDSNKVSVNQDEKLVLNSFFDKKMFDIEDITIISGRGGLRSSHSLEKKVLYKEYLPYELDREFNQYISKLFVFTNKRVSILDDDALIYNIDGKKIFFY